MESKTCTICCKNQTVLTCGICGCFSCKHCSNILAEDTFEYLEVVPENLSHDVYCPHCFDEVVAPELEEYQRVLEMAEQVNVYVKQQSSETRLIRRIQKPIKVLECDDREDALMRLAFFTAQKGFDTIVDVDIISHKVGSGSYKKLVWDGSGVPVDPKIRK